MFINNDLKYIHQDIAVILAKLFKALPLPSDIQIKVILSIKSGYHSEELTYLSEYQDMPFGAGQDIGPGHPQTCKFKRV
ncbi:MAG: hypothetical protein EZS28_003680 [Streblomastix strix]|uniref:Uncharacterized protein n=1 Tax=Streblomastix strix TaxID=222440 RepID=A0A5J4X0S7_9EUKA|nr:MAG: hypothetical protein EZS28_003680 [Streblomastix strix]